MRAEAVLKALAEPSRQAILRLVRVRPRSVGEIAEQVDITQQAVSQHLQVLKEAGLVAAHRQGTPAPVTSPKSTRWSPGRGSGPAPAVCCARRRRSLSSLAAAASTSARSARERASRCTFGVATRWSQVAGAGWAWPLPATTAVRSFDIDRKRGTVELRHVFRDIDGPFYVRLAAPTAMPTRLARSNRGWTPRRQRPWTDLWFYSNPMFVKTQ
jgi:DNA-binding transcriptional ArsR family regulator